MICNRAALAALALLPAVADAAPAAPLADADLAESAARVEAHVRFLADDLLEGREAGTRGFDLAALYVATQFRMLGLEPGGDAGSFFQEVPLLSGRLIREGARLAVLRDGTTTGLVFDEDFLPAINFDTGTCALEAPMVFVGQGVYAPELQHDDYAGVDVRGKVAVLLANAPARFLADQRAFHASGPEKLRELERRGAVGAVFLGDPESEARRAWARNVGNWERPGMRVLGADGRPLDTFPGLACRASVRVQRAGLFFEGAAHSADEVWAMLSEGRLRAFDLPGRIALASQAQLAPVRSRNVVARVPGRDDRLAREHVVLTAHLDHLGIGAPHGGDAIYNGAHDNAVGIGILLEAGRLLARDRARLRRSVLLVATTAEEKGLLGARHFVERPTVPLGSIVANVNMDMPLPFTEVVDVVPTGIEHSTLDGVARRAIARAGLALTPDPLPEEVTFVRSDQYPFVRAGIPAVYLKSGVRPTDGSDGLAQVKAFRASVYHLPNDDLTQPFDWPTAARLARVNQWIALEVSNAPQRPAWKPGNFFGGRFGGRLGEHDHDE